MRILPAIGASALLLSGCAQLGDSPPDRLSVAPADECQFVRDFVRNAHDAGGPPPSARGRTKTVLLRTASGSSPDWNFGGQGPSVETLANTRAKTANVRLDTCSSLSEDLAAFGWGFGGSVKGGGWYWGLSRVGFNAAHTEAVVFVVSGFGGATGNGGGWGWYRKDLKTGRWVHAGGGGGWIS